MLIFNITLTTNQLQTLANIKHNEGLMQASPAEFEKHHRRSPNHFLNAAPKLLREGLVTHSIEAGWAITRKGDLLLEAVAIECKAFVADIEAPKMKLAKAK